MVKTTGNQIEKYARVKTLENKFSKGLCQPTLRPERTFCGIEKSQSTD